MSLADLFKKREIRVGIRVETFVGGGRYQHSVYNVGKDAMRLIPEEVVEQQKRTNEIMWDSMPEGSSPVVSYIYYKSPRNS